MSVLALTLLTSCQKASSPMPEVNPAKLRITLQRSACYGSCPDYKVVIDGAGNVVFSTRAAPTDDTSAVHREYSAGSGVVVTGVHKAQVSTQQVQTLLDRARAADFFALKSEYRAAVTDNPTYVVTIDTGNGVKSIVDYVGLKAGMPVAVRNLEDAIDEVAGTKRWIEGTADVLPLLEAKNVDFASALGSALMAAAAERNEVSMLKRLKQFNASTNAAFGYDPLVIAAGAKALGAARYLLSDNPKVSETSIITALHQAARNGDNAMFRILLDAGKRPISKDDATRMLPAAAENSNFGIVSYLMAAGADVRGPADRRKYDDPPIFAAARGGFSEDGHTISAERRAVVTLLLQRGANIHQCALSCHSVLAYVSDPYIARKLITAGADPNYQDSDGEPLFFNIYDEDVALELINSGARLTAVRPADKMTLRGWAKYQKWPKVLSLLSQHGL